MQTLYLSEGFGDFERLVKRVLEAGGSRDRRGLGQHQFILSAMTTLRLLLGDYNFKSLRILWHLTHLIAAHQNRST